MKPIITTNFTSFKAGVIKLKAQVPRCSLRGIRLATEELRIDSLTQIPMCPFAEGTLLLDHKVLPAKQIGTRFECVLRVSGPYAASLHEGISRWGTPYTFKTPGTGAKWIESKLIRNSKKYLRIAADEFPK